MKLLVGYDGTHEKDTDNYDTIKTATYCIKKSPYPLHSNTSNRNGESSATYTMHIPYKEKVSFCVLIPGNIPYCCHNIDSPQTSIQKYHETFMHRSLDEALNPVLIKLSENDHDQWLFPTDEILNYVNDSVMETVKPHHSNDNSQKMQSLFIMYRLLAQNSKLNKNQMPDLTFLELFNQLQNVLEEKSHTKNLDRLNNKLLKEISDFTDCCKYYLEKIEHHSTKTKVAYDRFQRLMSSFTGDATTDALSLVLQVRGRDHGNDAAFDIGLEKSNSGTGTEKYKMANAVKAFVSPLQAKVDPSKIRSDKYSKIPTNRSRSSLMGKSLQNYPTENIGKWFRELSGKSVKTSRQHLRHTESSKPNIHSRNVHHAAAATTTHKINHPHTIHTSDGVQVKDKKYAMQVSEEGNVAIRLYSNFMEIFESSKENSEMCIDPKYDHPDYAKSSIVVVDPNSTNYEKMEKHISLEAQKVSKGVHNVDDDNSGDYHANHTICDPVDNKIHYHRTSVTRMVEKESKPQTKISIDQEFQHYDYRDSITCMESPRQVRNSEESVSDAEQEVPIAQPKVLHIPIKEQEVPTVQPKVLHIPKEQEVSTVQPKVLHIPKEQEVPIAQSKVLHIPIKEQEVPTVQPKVLHIPKEQEVPTVQPKVLHIPKEQEAPIAQPVLHVPKEQKMSVAQPKVLHIPKEQEAPIAQPVLHVPKEQKVPVAQPKVLHIPKEQEVPIAQPKIYLVPPKVLHVPKEQEVSIVQPKVLHTIPKEQEVPIAQPKVYLVPKEQEVSIAQPKVYLVPKEQELSTAECVFEKFQHPIQLVSIMMVDTGKNLMSSIKASKTKFCNCTACSKVPLLVVKISEQCMSTKTTNSSCANNSLRNVVSVDTTGQKQGTQNIFKLNREQTNVLCNSSLEILTVYSESTVYQQCKLLDSINDNGKHAFVSVQSPCTKQFVQKHSETSQTSLTNTQCLNKNCLVETSAPCMEEHILYANSTHASNITTLQIKNHVSCGAKNFQYQHHNEECSIDHLQDQQHHQEDCNSKSLHDQQLSSHSLQSIGNNALTYHHSSSMCYQSKEQGGLHKPNVTIPQPNKYNRGNTQCSMLDGCYIQNTPLPPSGVDAISCDQVPLHPCRDHATATIDVNGLLTDNSDCVDGTAQTVHVMSSSNLEVAKHQNQSVRGKVADCHMTSKPHAIIMGYRGFYTYGVFFHSNELCAIKMLLRFIHISKRYSPFSGLQRCTGCDLQCTIPYTLIPRYTIGKSAKTNDGMLKIQNKSTQLKDKDYKKVYSIPSLANCNQDCRNNQCLKPLPCSCRVILTAQLLQSHETANICNEAECSEVLSLEYQGVDMNSSCMMTKLGSVCIVNPPCVQEQKVQDLKQKNKKFTRLKICNKRGEPIATYQETFIITDDGKADKISNSNSCHENAPRDQQHDQQHEKLPPEFTPPNPPLHSKEIKHKVRTLDLLVQPQRHIVRCGKSKFQRYSTLKDYTDYRGRPPNNDNNATNHQLISVTREVDIPKNYHSTQNGLTGGNNTSHSGKQCASNTGNGQNSGNNTGNGRKGTHGVQFTGSSNGSSNGLYNNDNSKEGNNNEDDNDDDDDDNEDEDGDDNNDHGHSEETQEREDINITMTQNLTQEDVSSDQNLPGLAPSHLANDENRVYDTGGNQFFPAEFSAVQPVNLQPQYYDYIGNNDVNVTAEQETIEQPQYNEYIANDDLPVTVDAVQESIAQTETEVSNQIKCRII